MTYFKSKNLDAFKILQRVYNYGTLDQVVYAHNGEVYCLPIEQGDFERYETHEGATFGLEGWKVQYSVPTDLTDAQLKDAIFMSHDENDSFCTLDEWGEKAETNDIPENLYLPISYGFEVVYNLWTEESAQKVVLWVTRYGMNTDSLTLSAVVYKGTNILPLLHHIEGNHSYELIKQLEKRAIQLFEKEFDM